MVTPTKIKAALRWIVDSYVLFVVIGLAIGLTLAPVAMQVTGGSDGTVAVVPLDGSIDGRQAAAVSGMLREARQDPNVEAVVIVANSGGGSAVASEELYMQTKRTAEEMPVITIVDGGALSGAYHIIAPSDHVYVKPSSMVGSVGVIAQVPPDVEPNNLIGTTGPNKLTGTDEREFYHQLDTVQNAFLAAVYEHRSDELELTPGELGHARVYTGVDAVEKGLADEVGDRQIAIQHAADQAGLNRHRVGVLRQEDATATFVMRSTYLASTAPNREMVDPTAFLDRNPTPPTFLMLPPGVFATADTRGQLVGTYGETVAPVDGVAGDSTASANVPSTPTIDERGGADPVEQTGDRTDGVTTAEAPSDDGSETIRADPAGEVTP